MIKYFLIFELRSKNNYDCLLEELKKFNAISVFKSTWCLTFCDDKTEDLRDHFKKHIDRSDGIIVIKSSFWAGVKLNQNPNDL